MARIIDDQLNLWGRDQGIEAQRSDLWVIDFRQVLAGLKTVTDSATGSDTEFPNTENLMSPSKLLPTKTLATYFARSVSLPELRVKSEQVRRDSRSYQMPSWDEPLDPIRISFILDCFKSGVETSPYQSDIYNILDFWRVVVRAGLGPMSAEYAIRLNEQYRIDYAFNLPVKLLRPADPEIIFGNAKFNQFGSQPPPPRGPFDIDLQARLAQAGNSPSGVLLPTPPPTGLDWTSIQNDLQEALVLTLVNCWLGSFKVSDLSYEQARIVQIDATFYAENIEQKPIPAE